MKTLTTLIALLTATTLFAQHKGRTDVANTPEAKLNKQKIFKNRLGLHWR